MSTDLFSSVLFGLTETLREPELVRLAELLEGKKITSESSAITIEGLTRINGPTVQSIALLVRMWKDSPRSLAECLRTVLETRKRLLARTENVEIVWTGGGQYSVLSRTTYAVVKEMIASAKSKITVIGYEVTYGAAPIFKILARKREQGVGITLIVDRAEEQLGTIKRLWRSSSKLPEIFGVDAGIRLHAKLIIVDGADLLVTSANLTYGGLRKNIEIGVRVRGQTASRTDALIGKLLTENYFPKIATQERALLD